MSVPAPTNAPVAGMSHRYYVVAAVVLPGGMPWFKGVQVDRPTPIVSLEDINEIATSIQRAGKFHDVTVMDWTELPLNQVLIARSPA